jgi:hypothetical protein
MADLDHPVEATDQQRVALAGTAALAGTDRREAVEVQEMIQMTALG